ncbi:unnamed protein product [Urochloa humidicola]
MAIGAFVEGAPAGGGEGYSGRVTPFVVLSCVVAGSGGVLFGYDLGISGGVTSMDSFLKKFFPEVYRQSLKQDTRVSHYCKFNSELLTMFTSSLYIAGLVATLVAASITRRYGRRVSMLIGGTVFVAGSVFGGAAVNIPMLILNRILLGIGLGFTNQSIPLYLSEMAPPRYRGAINNGFELCISLGILFANILNYFVIKITAGWGWRISLSMAALPAAFLTMGAIFLPETPSFIIQRDGDTDKARILLQKLRGTTSVQKELDDLVTGINVMNFYAPVMFRILGLKEQASLLSSVVTRLCATFANIIAMMAVDRFGRRKLFLVGGVQMILSQFTVGAILAAKFKDYEDMDSEYAYLVLITMCVFVAGFAWSWGPLTFLVPAEVCPLEIRSAGQSIVVAVVFLMAFVIGQTFLEKLPMEQMEQIWRRHWFWKKIVGEEVEKKQAESGKTALSSL